MIKNSPIGGIIGMCRIKTGSYTGDGSEGLSITGIGFTPKVVIITHRPVDVANHYLLIKTDHAWGDYCLRIYTSIQATANNINSIDPDGFTVDDAGVDAHPNRADQLYDYIVIG